MGEYRLDATLRNELFEILGPSLVDPTERRAIVWVATESDRGLIEGLDWEGPPEVLLIRLLERLDPSPNLPTILDELLSSAEPKLDPPTRDRATRLRQRLTRMVALTPADEPHAEQDQAGPVHFRVFISSPADVADERAVAAQVVEHLAYDPLVRGWVTTEVVAWDRPTAVPLLAGDTPQASIDVAALTPEACDAVLVILWSRIGTRLKQRSDVDYPAESGTEFEYRRATAAFGAFGTPAVIVYNRTEPAWVQLGSSDLDDRRDQWAAVRAFITGITGGNGGPPGGVNTYSSTDEFRALVEFHLRELIRRRYGRARASASHGTQSTEATELVIPVPYPGLRPFDTDDSVVFFGRGIEVDELVERLAAADGRFVAIVGASGSGKSSLVSAGLLPRLSHDAIHGSSGWRVVRTTPDKFGLGNPFIALGIAIDSDGFDGKRDGGEWRASELVLRIRAAESRAGATSTLLIIDQFEELFTSVDPTAAFPYIDQVLELLAEGSSRVVLTIRSDFYNRCLEHTGLAAALRRGSFPLSAPGLASLYQMITRPAEKAGIDLERGLAERILNDTGVHTGALALMAFTLSELLATASGAVLRHEQYDRLGGVQGAVGARAAAAFDALDPEAQGELSVVFRHLITVNDDGAPTRQRGRPSHWSGNLAAQGRFIQAFVDARLLVSGLDAEGHVTVEVAHEALFQSWPRLATWIDDVRDDLRIVREVERAALEWARHTNDRAYLWTEERMSPARTAVERLGPTGVEPDVAATIIEFLTPEVERLAAELVVRGVSHSRRALIGERLAELGDTRPGVGVADGVPALEWCPVPGGVVRLDGLSENFGVTDFHIAKYPITSAQYEAFVAADDGYHNLDWWDGMPRRAVPPEAYRRLPNHPMESLNWYEAVAFCRWLTHRLGFVVRLPTEVEWQIAANGADSGRLFPWGSEWDDDRANTQESGLGRTVAVGMYPLGAAPCGAQDLMGNVWEWCLNESDDPLSTIIEEAEQRAVRGGCWFHAAGYCITSFRNVAWDYAAPRTQLRGFRVARPAHQAK